MSGAGLVSFHVLSDWPPVACSTVMEFVEASLEATTERVDAGFEDPVQLTVHPGWNSFSFYREARRLRQFARVPTRAFARAIAMA